MALRMFRLAGTTPVATSTNYAYFFIPLTTQITIAAGATFTASLPKWTTGAGSTPGAFVSATGYNLCINGVLQQSGLYTVSSTKLNIIAPASAGITIPISAPMTLQALNTAITPTSVAVP